MVVVGWWRGVLGEEESYVLPFNPGDCIMKSLLPLENY